MHDSGNHDIVINKLWYKRPHYVLKCDWDGFGDTIEV